MQHSVSQQEDTKSVVQNLDAHLPNQSATTDAM